jgi:hypothetical protein
VFSRNFFTKDPLWLTIQPLKNKITPQEVPKELEINSIHFVLILSIIHVNDNHFQGIFYLNKQTHLVDDLGSCVVDKYIPVLSISAAIYVRMQPNS